MYHDHEKRSFYVDEHLTVHPCCFYASAYINAKKDEVGTFDTKYEKYFKIY